MDARNVTRAMARAALRMVSSLPLGSRQHHQETHQRQREHDVQQRHRTAPIKPSVSSRMTAPNSTQVA